jgi:hypothetical protein
MLGELSPGKTSIEAFTRYLGSPTLRLGVVADMQARYLPARGEPYRKQSENLQHLADCLKRISY